MKNETHSKLYKEYCEVKRKIGIYQRRIQIEKGFHWDIWEEDSPEVFYTCRRQIIDDYRYFLKKYHEQTKELKKLIYLSQKEFNEKRTS